MDNYMNSENFRAYKKNEVFTYGLTIEGHTKAKVIESDFKMSSVHELTFLDYDSSKKMWHFHLKELSYKLDKYDDSTVVQIIEASNEISKIYQDLDFWVNRYGVIKQLCNLDQIYQCWAKVREYLTYKYPMSSYEIIMAKEKELSNEELLIRNIRYIHFIFMYFMQYGMYEREGDFVATDTDRFGSCASFNMNYRYTTEEQGEKIHRHFEGDMIPDREARLKMTKNVEDEYASVVYQTKADYHSDGVIVEEANFSFTENIGKTYSMYSNLHLVLDGYVG